MSTTVTLENYNESPVASTLFTKQIPSGESDTRTLPDIDADNYAVDYARCAKMGILATVNSTVQAGSEVIDDTATLDDATRTVRAETVTNGAFTITLMAIADVDTGTILYINFSEDGGDLTLDGAGYDEIDGAATKVLSAVGTTRLQSDGTQWVTL